MRVESVGAGTFNAAETGRAGTDHLAGRNRPRGRGDRPATGDLAQDGRSLAARLSDAPRCGAPATFTPEVICRIMAMACEDPETLDVPISHWSQSELARQAVARGIVDSISHGSVGRFLKTLL